MKKLLLLLVILSLGAAAIAFARSRLEDVE